MTDRWFEFRFTRPYRIAALPFGVLPSTCELLVEGGRLLVRFGLWRVTTALDNISRVELTGPYAFIRTAGPAHLSLADKGLTFATNGDRGVCIRFRSPIKGIEPTGALRHPSLTVTVADCQGLGEVLNARN